MSLILEEMEQYQPIIESFARQYMSSDPRSDYITRVGISVVGRERKNVLEREKGKPCLVVTLRKQLPEKLTLPPEYQGLEVFVRYE